MSSHYIYSSTFEKLSKSGSRNITTVELASLTNDVMRSISVKYPARVNEVEELLYSIILHDAITYNGFKNVFGTYPYNCYWEKGRLVFDTNKLPVHLCQILHTILIEIIS